MDYSIDAGLMWIAHHPKFVGPLLVGLPVLTALIGFPLKKASPKAARLFLSVPTHIAVLQGVSCAFLLLYAQFILHADLTKINVLTHFIPLFSAGATLWVVSRLATFEELPGFDRLETLALAAGFAFAIFYTLDRLHVFVGLFGLVPWAVLVGLFGGVSALWQRMRGGRP